MTASEAHAAIEAVVRIESARLIAGLASYTGDVGLAEELAQDAVVAALEQWPQSGVPRNAGAWLMTVAKRRAVDTFRRNRELRRKYAQMARSLEAEGASVTPDFDRAFSDHIDDDMLRLMFTACHPVLAVPARAALTLRLLGGLTTAEIARAYLVPEPTIAQRIVRAKRALARARVPFEVPEAQARPARLASVLEVIYLIFNEGYSATAGDDWMRPALCAEALRLSRILAQLMPDEPEVHGLAALLEIQASRIRARTGPSGEPILLLDQDRHRWDRLLINRGLAALARADQLGGAGGPYALQAAIAACHARAFRPEDTDWERIAGLYAVLARVMPSPVIELNRAVAVAMAFGPEAGLGLVDALAAEPSLQGYHLLPSVRGDLLMKLGRPGEARAEFERAAALTRNQRERDLSAERAREAAAAAADGWPAAGDRPAPGAPAPARGAMHNRLPGMLRVCYDCVTRVRDSGVGVNGMTPATKWTRVTRRLGLDHNPLRRTSDVVEAWLLPAVIAVFLILSPFVAGAAALSVRAENTAAQRATQSWHQVPAVLLRAAPGPMMSDNGSNTWLVWTPARWAAGGRPHTGNVPAPAGTKAGATVRVWLDRAGDVQVPPPSGIYARDRVLVGMLIAEVILALVLALLALLTQWILDRRRLAGWEAAWLSVGPQWSRHT